MIIQRITWLFGGLFMLFGLLILTTENEAVQKLWAGLCSLSLGAFGLSMSRDAVLGGQIRLQNSTIRQATQPRLFWAAVGLVSVAGIGVLISGLWFLFFKT